MTQTDDAMADPITKTQTVVDSDSFELENIHQARKTLKVLPVAPTNIFKCERHPSNRNENQKIDCKVVGPNTILFKKVDEKVRNPENFSLQKNEVNQPNPFSAQGSRMNLSVDE